MSFKNGAVEFGLLLSDLKKLPNYRVIKCYLLFETAKRGKKWIKEYCERRELEMWEEMEKVAEAKPEPVRSKLLGIATKHVIRLLQVRNLRNVLRDLPTTEFLEKFFEKNCYMEKEEEEDEKDENDGEFVAKFPEADDKDVNNFLKKLMVFNSL
jgi:hypothetical protein